MATPSETIWYRATETKMRPRGGGAWVELVSRGRGRLHVPGRAAIPIVVLARTGRGADLQVRVRPRGPSRSDTQTPVCPAGTERCGDPLPGHDPPCCAITTPTSNPYGMPPRMAARAAASGSGGWYPAISNAQLGGGLGNQKVVLYQGGGTGWLGTGSNFAALIQGQHVIVNGTQAGGPTGLLVHVVPVAAVALAANPTLDLTGCCIDRDTLTIMCPGGEAQWYMHGRTLPAATVGWSTDSQGGEIAIITTGDETYTLPVCPSKRTPPPQEPPPPPPTIPVPPECCYDAASATLSCPSGAPYDGMAVKLVSMFDGNDGRTYAIVTGEGISGQITIPLCENVPPPECCYDTARGVIVCTSSSEYDGKVAGVVTTFTGHDGTPWVSLAWPGGGARMPVCNEPCPGFCCINLDTHTWVCPEDPSRNGTAAQVAQVMNDGGGRWALLVGGGRVPVCGTDCPPPRLCPDCPGCPPGMWMSPDGSCTDPPPCVECPPCKHPSCPPGWLLDTQSGRCVQCPPGWVPPPEQCPPWWELGGHCCENCALDQPCAGPEGGCNCSGDHGPNTNPCDNPDGDCALAENPYGSIDVLGAARHDQCLAYIDGIPRVLIWKTAGQVEPILNDPSHTITVLEQNGVMVHVTSQYGFDRWMKRCPEYDRNTMMSLPSTGLISAGPVTRPGAFQQGTGMTPGASIQVRGNPDDMNVAIADDTMVCNCECHSDQAIASNPGNCWRTQTGATCCAYPGQKLSIMSNPFVSAAIVCPEGTYAVHGVDASGNDQLFCRSNDEVMLGNPAPQFRAGVRYGGMQAVDDIAVTPPTGCPEGTHPELWTPPWTNVPQWRCVVDAPIYAPFLPPTTGLISAGPVSRPGAFQQGTGMQPGASLARSNPALERVVIPFGTQSASIYAPYWTPDGAGIRSLATFYDPTIFAYAQRGQCWLEADDRGQVHVACPDARAPVPMMIGRRAPVSAALRRFRYPVQQGPHCYVREQNGTVMLCCINGPSMSFCMPLSVAPSSLAGYVA